MIGKYVQGRVYVFVDVANVLYAQKRLGWRVSYERLKSYFERECDLRKIIAYTGSFEANLKQRKFLDMLEIVGYEVRVKEVKKIRVARDKYIWKGNLDVELALDMVELRDDYDTAVLISGDSDFAIVLEKLKVAGKKVVVISTRGRVAKELIERSTKYIDLRRLRCEVSQ